MLYSIYSIYKEKGHTKKIIFINLNALNMYIKDIEAVFKLLLGLTP